MRLFWKYSRVLWIEFFFVFFVIFISLFYGVDFLDQDSDVFWHIKQGQWLIENQKCIIDKEIFCYNFEKLEWFYLAWLADIIQAWIYLKFGLLGVILQSSLLVGSIVYIPMKYLQKKKVPSLLILGYTGLFLSITTYHWIPRPVLYSYVFIGIWFWIIDDFVKGEKNRLFLLPLLQIIWTNLHSSFIYGFAVIGLFIIGGFLEGFLEKNREKIRKTITLIFITTVSMVTSLINPFGYKVYYEMFFDKNSKAMGEYSKELINEYASPDFHVFGNGLDLLIIMMVLLTLFVFLKNGFGKNISYMIFLLFWLNSAFEYRRHLIILGIVLLFIVPQILVIEKTRHCLIGVVFVFIGIILMINQNIFKIENYNRIIKQDFYKRYPKKVMEYLKSQQDKSGIYNSYLYGGYLIWEFYPEKLVFIDPRASVYPLVYLTNAIDISLGTPYIYRLFHYYKIKTIVLEKRKGLYKILLLDKDFEVKYEDKMSIVFRWKDDAAKKLDDKYGKEFFKGNNNEGKF